MTAKTLNRSFAAGEISPQLFSRLDLDKFQTGVALCLNCETTAQGPLQNRPGFQYVIEAKTGTNVVRLIPFSYSTQQTFALEFGQQYIRFHTQGATLLEPARAVAAISTVYPAEFRVPGHGFITGQWVRVSPIAGPASLGSRWAIVASYTADAFILTDLAGVPLSAAGQPAYAGGATVARVYEVASPYQAGDIPQIHYVQSADVLTLAHPNYPPMELRRMAPTRWELSGIIFSSGLAPPQSNTTPPSAITHTYRVVAVANNAYSAPSAPVSCSNDLSIPGRFNIVGWTSVPGGQLYHVYKLIGGQWQYIAFSFGGTYIMDDSSVVPNPTVPLFNGPGAPPTATAAAVAPASTGVSVVPTGGGSTAYSYVVTSLNDDATEESIPSAPVTVSNSLGTAGNVNTVRWPAVPGVRLYNIYRSVNGIFGYIGRADAGCSFVDNNIAPDTGITPPVQLNPFQGEGNYPRAVSYYEQRRIFGGTNNAPQTLWMTRSGTERNLGYSFPSRSDDGISVRVVAREANTIRHIVPMGEMMLLTSGGEWKVAAADGGALTPASISVKPQGYTGASDVQPVVTNRTILFAQDRGGHVRELEFSWQQQGYQTSDVSILAPHLFDYRQVVQLAFTRSPLQALWAVRDDGMLLGMTYVPEHEIRAWHRHTTDGSFTSVCVVSEGDEDAIYVVVARIVNARVVRYIERRHTRRFDRPADQFFVDSGITYRGAPASTFTGLHHLEGKKVAILADGGVSPPQVVVGGAVTIEAPASVVHIGLPYTARVQTLPLSVQTQAFGQGTVKNINKVHLRVQSSSGFKAGPTFERLRQYQTRLVEPYGSAPALVTGEVSIVPDPMWSRDGALCVQQDDPVAFTLLGVAMEVATGS